MDRQHLRGILIEKFPREHGQLLSALHFLQDEFDYLPEWAMEIIGWHLGIPASEVYGAATSYTELRLQEPESHLLRICTGLSCWINGGEEILGAATGKLGDNHPDQISTNYSVQLEETPCGFLCSVAPVVQLDKQWYGRVEIADIERMFTKEGPLE